MPSKKLTVLDRLKRNEARKLAQAEVAKRNRAGHRTPQALNEQTQKAVADLAKSHKALPSQKVVETDPADAAPPAAAPAKAETAKKKK